MVSNLDPCKNYKILANPATSYSCQNCGKNYNDNSVLWRHKQKCNMKQSESPPFTVQDTNIMSDKELITMLVKQNSELMNVIKNGTVKINKDN
jgi:hypothetical protein